MKIAKVIARVDELVNNTYSEAMKKEWLSELDHQVYNDILMTHEGAPEGDFVPYDEDTDAALTELLIPEPYSRAYISYLAAQVHFYLQEPESYNSQMVRFNSEYAEYAGWYNQKHMPVCKDRVSFGRNNAGLTWPDMLQ